MNTVVMQLRSSQRSALCLQSILIATVILSPSVALAGGCKVPLTSFKARVGGQILRQYTDASGNCSNVQFTCTTLGWQSPADPTTGFAPTIKSTKPGFCTNPTGQSLIMNGGNGNGLNNNGNDFSNQTRCAKSAKLKARYTQQLQSAEAAMSKAEANRNQKAIAELTKTISTLRLAIGQVDATLQQSGC